MIVLLVYNSRLISKGKGVEVVQTIKDVSVSRRNVKQNSLLLAYAICARSNDKDTKKAAYSLLSDICRIPTHLFMFVKYCEQESKSENDSGMNILKRSTCLNCTLEYPLSFANLSTFVCMRQTHLFFPQ